MSKFLQSLQYVFSIFPTWVWVVFCAALVVFFVVLDFVSSVFFLFDVHDIIFDVHDIIFIKQTWLLHGLLVVFLVKTPRRGRPPVPGAAVLGKQRVDGGDLVTLPDDLFIDVLFDHLYLITVNRITMITKSRKIMPSRRFSFS